MPRHTVMSSTKMPLKLGHPPVHQTTVFESADNANSFSKRKSLRSMSRMAQNLHFSCAVMPGRPNCLCQSSPISQNLPYTIAARSQTRTTVPVKRDCSIAPCGTMRKSGMRSLRYSPRTQFSKALSTNMPSARKPNAAPQKWTAHFWKKLRTGETSSLTI